MPRAAAAAAMAAGLLLLLAGGAHAQPIASPYAPEGTGFGYMSVQDKHKELADQLLRAFTAMANGQPAVVASSAPINATPEAVATVAGTILATVAASARRSPLSTLGDPKVFPYPDGSGRVALYRMPRGKPKGTCIFIHGCKHDPFSWFYKSPRCPQCTGLPEEVSHSKQCLARGYAVLALMSLNREYRSRCFASSGAMNDQPSAAQCVQQWSRKVGLNRKPMYMFGISSGASFAIKFPMTMRIQGVISEVNMPWEKNWGATNGNGKLRVPFPPTAFFMMERDLQTKRQIEKAVTLLNNNGVNSDYVYVPSVPVTPEYLSMRSIYISPEQSATIQKFLIKIKVLNKKGTVRYDVRVKRGWIKQLPKFLPWLKRSDPYYNLISDESQIWQALNVAWAWHEIYSDPVDCTLQWFEKKGRMSLKVCEKQVNRNIVCLTEKKIGC